MTLNRLTDCINWSKFLSVGRAGRYDDIYRMDEIKSLSFHIMLYRLFRGVAKYIVYGNTFFIIWMTAWRVDTEAGGSE